MTGRHEDKRFAVLYVDDEEQSLKYFRKAFEKDFSILTASSAAEALELLKDKAPDTGVVVADQRMPNQTGVELLGRIRRSWPSIVRVLTTAYSDLDSAIEAVNSGEVFRYVVKPWNLRELRGNLLRAMEFFDVRRERDALLREKLSTLERMMATDRIRSLAIMAAALASRLRDPLSALDAFLDAGAPMRRTGIVCGADEKQALRPVDIWALAREDSRFQRSLVERLVNQISDPGVFDAAVPVSGLLAPALQQAKEAAEAHGGSISVDIAGELPDLAVDRPIAERLFTALLGCAARAGQGGGIALCARQSDVSGLPGVRVSITADGAGSAARQGDMLSELLTSPAEGGGEQEIDLLSAYFFAGHHGGTISIKADGEDRVTLEVQLPCDPTKVRPTPPSEARLTELFGLADAWEHADKDGPD